VAGTEYAIVVDYPTAPPEGALQAVANWSGGTGNPYAGGQQLDLFFGSNWSVYNGAGFDLHFQTFVDPVPEPATCVPVLLSILVLLGGQPHSLRVRRRV
jgi:hypothetical protein